MKQQEQASRGVSAGLGGLVVAMTALLLLALAEPRFRTEEVYLKGHANDQIGYITTARWLADTGELRSHLIYPAYADQANWRLYMPGHYYALAAVFRWVGYSPFLTRLPCLLAYIVSSMGTYLIGRRLYGHGAGLVAAALFLAHPLGGYYAFSALADMTVTAAVVVSFVLFVHLPARLRFWLVPLILIGPFLFRETASFVVIPMSLMAFTHARELRWPRFLVAALGSVVSLTLVNRWQMASGKEATPLSWITQGEFNYGDVTQRKLATPDAEAWVTGLGTNLGNNLDQLSERYGSRLTDSPEPLATAAVLIAALVLLGWGWKRRSRDVYPLASALVTTTTALLVLGAYSVYGFRLARTLLFTLPLISVGLGAGLVRVAAPRLPGLGRLSGLFAFAVVALVLGLLGMRACANEVLFVDPTAGVQRVENYRHDDDKVLIAPPSSTFDYVLDHYPVRYCFPPENTATLHLVHEHHDIGTVVEDEAHLQRELLELDYQRTRKASPSPRSNLWVFQ